MASLLGNLIFAGLATLLSTQTTVGAINSVPNLYSINTGAASTAAADSALFQPVFPQGTGALGAGIGPGTNTLQPLLFTRTGTVAVWYNPNTTALAGETTIAFWHSQIR